MTRDALLALHVPGTPLLIPNPWDVGSARLFEALGAKALATTSSGFAASVGHVDGDVTLKQVLTHCEDLSSAVSIPVAADFENGYADSLEDLADNYRLAASTGLSGASIEDWSGSSVYDLTLATERVATARAAASDLVLTGRAEGYLHGNPSLSDAITRLQAYAVAGADVLYAPGLTDLDEIRTLIREVPKPVNVLLLPGLEVSALADAGVARISVGSMLSWTAWNAVSVAAQDFLGGGSSWLADAVAGRREAARVIG
jgi:2-methylisocitrate lyase-like PEP mutase family enzyme